MNDKKWTLNNAVKETFLYSIFSLLKWFGSVFDDGQDSFLLQFVPAKPSDCLL